MSPRFMTGLVVFLVVSAFQSIGTDSYGVPEPHAWVQQQEITPSNGTPDDDFGAVAVSGNTIVVGSRMHSVGKNNDQGTAYIFTRSGSSWNQVQELTASDGAAYDQFGTAVAISGTTALIDAPFHAVGNRTAQGVVYVFHNVHGKWKQTQKLTSGDGQSDDYFGASLAMYRSSAIIGALFHGNGAAYIFSRAGGSWAQRQELTDPGSGGGQFRHQFGTSVGISRGEAIVSAPDTTVGANTQQGTAYIYVKNKQGWTNRQQIEANNGVSGQEFGAGTGFGPALAISGDTAIVGAFYTNNFHGTAYVFRNVGGTWTQTQQLTPSDLSTVSEFGTVVTILQNAAMIGAQQNGSTQAGSVYVFGKTGGGWTQTQELNPSNASAGDMFGSSLGMTASTSVIGAFHVKTQTGAAYVFAG